MPNILGLDGNGNPSTVEFVQHRWEVPKRVKIPPTAANLAASPVAASIGGALAFMYAWGLSLLIIGFVAFKRYQSKSILASRE